MDSSVLFAGTDLQKGIYLLMNAKAIKTGAHSYQQIKGHRRRHASTILKQTNLLNWNFW